MTRVDVSQVAGKDSVFWLGGKAARDMVFAAFGSGGSNVRFIGGIDFDLKGKVDVAGRSGIDTARVWRLFNGS